MQTVILDEPGRLRVDATPEPSDPGPGEAVVSVHRVGVCGTDIHAYRGEQPFFDYPRILGHELGVEVLAVGPGVESVAPGDRCAVEPYLNCGYCLACRRGRTNCCETLRCLGVHTDGGMRSRIKLPAKKLHRSETLGLDELALVETLGIGKHAVSRAQPTPGESAAVLGAGPIGLGAATFARLAGADVVVADVRQDRLDIAAELTGCETLRIEPAEPLAEQWQDTRGELPATVFDATGHRGSMQSAFALPAASGTLVLVGLVLGEIAFDDPTLHRKELSVLASRNSVGQDFRDIIAAMEAGHVGVRPWVTHRASAADWPSVFESWLAPDAGLFKGVVAF